MPIFKFPVPQRACNPRSAAGPGKKNLKLSLAANKRLNTAYLLKESFGQRWIPAARPGRGSSSRTGERA